MMQSKRIIGLTGATGSGKGEVCRILKEKGAVIIDTDSLSHDVILAGRPAYHEILAAFGTGILDEKRQISRKHLGNIVFASKPKLKKLSRIVHKYVVEECKKLIENTSSGIIVIDAPLLIEAGIQNMCCMVVGVFAPENIRLERIINRDNISRADAELRMASQMPARILRAYVHASIENNGTLDALKEQVLHLWPKIQGKD